MSQAELSMQECTLIYLSKNKSISLLIATKRECQQIRNTMLTFQNSIDLTRNDLKIISNF